MEGTADGVFQQKAMETLHSLRTNNRNFLCSPLYGQSCLVCCCFQKIGLQDNLKLMRDKLKRHLRTHQCYAYSDIEEEFDSYILEINDLKKASSHSCLYNSKLSSNYLIMSKKLTDIYAWRAINFRQFEILINAAKLINK
jgi:hypothetical protein